MKKIIQTVGLFIFIASTVSCTGQKLVQTIPDVEKLKDQNEQFIGKPLKYLLSEIKPPIKLAYGNPDDASESKLGSISYCFMDLPEFRRMKREGKEPLTLIIIVERSDDRQFPKLDPGPWTDEKTKTYGDMIVRRIGVLGKG